VFQIVEKGQKPFPIERAILLSLAGHALIVFLLVTAPPTSNAPPRPGGLLAAFVPPDPEEPPIPVVFREAPGPARENPLPADPSDATRRAGGGEASRPKSETPFFQPLPGIEGLEPGPRGGRKAPAPEAPSGDAAARRGESERGSQDDPGRGVFGPRGETSTDREAGSGFNLTPPGAPAREGEKLSRLDQAIRDAARDTAAGGVGQEGAGFPNPDGGFVDSGPLSFDTTWYDWGPYAAEMVRRIRLNWEIPELARLGWKGKLTIRFFILADGHVADAKIIRGSGIPPFDFAALQAILKSSPFRPLPRDLQSEREGVTVTFFYNIRPEKDVRPEGTR
jgi:TonB family protein